MAETDALEVVKRMAGLYQDVPVVMEAKTAPVYVSLGNSMVYAIKTAEKNGATLAAGSTGDTYEWKSGRPNVKLNASTVVNDFLRFRVQIQMDDAAVNDFIEEATRWCLARLVPFYPDATVLDTTQIFLNAVHDISIGRIREFLSRGETNSAYYKAGKELREKAEAFIMAVARGEADLLDANDNLIEREAGMVVGHFAHADGAMVDRTDLRKRIAKWDGVGLMHHPKRHEEDGGV